MSHVIKRIETIGRGIERRCMDGQVQRGGEALRLRIAQYPQGFLTMEVDGSIVGFIKSGCSFEVMSDESFKELVGHDAQAPNVVLMSVVVAPAHQGKGYSKLLMNEFVARMKRAGKQTIHLMREERHVELYTRMGYRYVKASTSDHGGMSWHEMVMEL